MQKDSCIAYKENVLCTIDNNGKTHIANYRRDTRWKSINGQSNENLMGPCFFLYKSLHKFMSIFFKKRMKVAFTHTQNNILCGRI